MEEIMLANKDERDAKEDDGEEEKKTLQETK